MIVWLLLWMGTPDQEALVRQIAESGRVIEIAERRLEEPTRFAPGAPPLLSFRLLDGRERHRFGKLDLVLDDAGH